MTITADFPWRSLPPLTRARFVALLAGTPLSGEAARVHYALNTMATIGLLILWREQGRGGANAFAQETHNPWLLRRWHPTHDGRPVKTHPRDGDFLDFRRYEDAAWELEWRLTDPGYKPGNPGVYARTTTLLELNEVYSPAGDGANDPVARTNAMVIDANNLIGETPMPDLLMTKGLIPLPKITKRLITPAMKPEGVGWDDLGPRFVKGFVLHRMQGTLWGTDGHFRNPAVGALTDFGCDHQTGEIIQWNDPHGRMSGWASGRVSQPYGDGKAFIDKYGIVAVNRDQVSWELAGFFIAPGVTIESPWSDTSKQVTAQALAHYAHDYGIPWDVFPVAPQDGFSFVRWHQEFTIGTGKTCPGKVVMDATNALIERSRAIMKAAQLVATEPPGPIPTPAPGIVYPGDMDKDLAIDLFGTVTTANGTVYQFNEAGQVSRLWLEVGAAAEPDRYPRLRRVIDGKSGQRWFAFEGGMLVRQKGNLVEVVDSENAQAA